jgi:signal transduction histidine kinase
VTISIRARVLGVFLLLIAMAALETGLVLYVQREAVGALEDAERTRRVLHDNDEIGRALAGMQSALRGFLITGAQEEVAAYKGQYQHYLRVAEGMRPLVADAEQRARFERILVLVEEWRRGASEAVLDRARRGDQLVTWIETTSVPRFNRARDEIVAFEHRQTLLANDASATARARLARTTWILVSTPIASIVIMLALMVATNRAILRPLASLATSARRLAAADYEATLPPARQHEIGELVSAFSEMRTAVGQRAAKAAELDRMKDEFVSVVSHELRTPLTAIRGSLQLLLSDHDAVPDPENRHLLKTALNSCERLVRIVSDILDVSKIEAGRLTLRPRELSLAEVVAHSIDGVRQIAAQGGVRFVDNVPRDLPHVAADADRLTQAVINLLSNAVKFSPPNSTVTIDGRQDAGSVTISVRDQGPGIPAEDIPRLFEKFHQLDGSGTRRVGGTGLGLVITKAIIEQHGGEMRVESRAGAGSTFSVVLPVPPNTELTETRRLGEQ